jgi:hypothetical protein
MYLSIDTPTDWLNTWDTLNGWFYTYACNCRRYIAVEYKNSVSLPGIRICSPGSPLFLPFVPFGMMNVGVLSCSGEAIK